MKTGELQGHADGVPTTVADGLRTTLGSNNFPIIKDFVESVFLVAESQIVAGMRLTMERMKVVVEPSAGVGVAVALWHPEFLALKGISKVGIVLCGGNVDLEAISSLLQKYPPVRDGSLGP